MWFQYRQVTCDFAFGSACALGIPWQLDLRTEGLSDGRVSLVFFKGIAAYTHIGCLQRLSLWGWCMITIFRCPSWQSRNKNNTFDCLSCKARAGCSGDDEQSVPTLCKIKTPWKSLLLVLICWSVWRRQRLQAKDFSSQPCLQWKWKLASVSAQDLKTAD